MRSTDRQYKMHFISNIYRFIFFLILLAITIIGIITYYNFSRQNHTYSINYNMSAVSGLTHMIEEQEDSFMQCINNAFLITTLIVKDFSLSHRIAMLRSFAKTAIVF